VLSYDITINIIIKNNKTLCQREEKQTYTSAFKAKVALEAIKEQETIAQIASRFEVLPVQVSQWKAQLIKQSQDCFERPGKSARRQEDWDKKEAHLHQKIGQLEVERDWLKKNLNSSVSSPEAKRSMLESDHKKLSIKRQCKLLSLPRSTAYYRAVDLSQKDLPLMKHIDELYTKYPFFGSRQMPRMLASEGIIVNRKRVQRLMRKMGLEAIYPKPNLSRRHKQHAVYPYLLRGVSVLSSNQVWCADITFIRLGEGYAYLVAIMDWYSRKVLSWKLSNSLDSSFCVSALQTALKEYGAPVIFNTDQGSQFTSSEWVSELKRHGIKISMDGRGRALDNVFVERLWRTLKYEEVYLREYAGLSDARDKIREYFVFYNQLRPHSSLGDKTPSAVYKKIAT
jgi:putative transposase